jgi:glutamate synthase (NADPH/NADH) small chain
VTFCVSLWATFVGDPKAFMRLEREGATRRPVTVRVRDWREVYEPFAPDLVRTQAARCMDCGIPFCHEGCPLGNLIPEWNDLVYRDRLADAADRLEATNNFPELTGRLCPAPCEGSCVLGINAEPVSIKQVELEIAERGAQRLQPRRAAVKTGKRIAIVGSGPAGLAAAQQLTRAGHDVVVYERAERAGGLLRYGIPEFKMEKRILDRRLVQMVEEGTVFRTSVAVGPCRAGGAEVPGAADPAADVVSAHELRADFDALVLAGGSTRPRPLEVPGSHLDGVHFAMDYLKPSNQVCEGSLTASPINAAGRHVVIIGGGDTGADCLGTVHRQGAASVRQLEILPAPPATRAADNPWPTWPLVFRTSSAHEEGGSRLFGVTTAELVGRRDGGGHVRALRLRDVATEVLGARTQFIPVPGTERELEADLVLIAMGFLGPERAGVVAELGLGLDVRGNVAVRSDFATPLEGVFACGDMARGQSLIVWAIAEGRAAASEVDRFLMGTTSLPRPILAGQMALR